jgi:hypothetical protein
VCWLRRYLIFIDAPLSFLLFPAELENLADIIKEAMFENYKLAYSEEGEAHKEEAESTVTVG